MVDIANNKAGVGGLCFVVGAALILGGCAGNSAEPAQLGRFRSAPAVNVILDSLGAADEPTVAWEKGEEPQPCDTTPGRTDQTLRPGDVVRISIYELLREGVMATDDYVVSDMGKLSLPEIGPVQAAGLTEAQLELQIKRALTPAVLKNPVVSVARVDSQQQMYSVLGVGVTQPGRYAIPARGLRLADALAVAGGLGQFNVSYVYVSRSEDASAGHGMTLPAREVELIEPQTNSRPALPVDTMTTPSPTLVPSGKPSGLPQPSQPADKFETQQEMLDLITPFAKAKPKTLTTESDRANGGMGERATSPKLPSGGTQGTSHVEDISATMLPAGVPLVMPGTRAVNPRDEVQTFAEFGNDGAARPSQPSGAGEKTEWVFKDGQWVPVTVPSSGAGANPTRGAFQPTLNPAFSPSRGTPEAAKPAQQPTSIDTPKPSAPAVASTSGRTNEEPGEWVFKEGRWVQVRSGRPEPAKPALAVVLPNVAALPVERENPPVEAEPDQPTQNRLIKIPAERLLAGDPRYNIYIRPGDVIHVPVDVVGEFCITGNVARTGYINMTGRSMTLKQAIAAAGGLSPMACPQYCEVVRRIGNREEIVMVDLDKISRGEQPDFFIKPNDLINVGTNPSAQWRAAMRNEQKPAASFTFAYDRNFSDSDYGLRSQRGN
jgi:protein involved in polysaccharide export with SLBB domain